jgi:hypothetical protein
MMAVRPAKRPGLIIPMSFRSVAGYKPQIADVALQYLSKNAAMVTSQSLV